MGWDGRGRASVAHTAFARHCWKSTSPPAHSKNQFILPTAYCQVTCRKQRMSINFVQGTLLRPFATISIAEHQDVMSFNVFFFNFYFFYVAWISGSIVEPTPSFLYPVSCELCVLEKALRYCARLISSLIKTLHCRSKKEASSLVKYYDFTYEFANCGLHA